MKKLWQKKKWCFKKLTSAGDNMLYVGKSKSILQWQIIYFTLIRCDYWQFLINPFLDTSTTDCIGNNWGKSDCQASFPFLTMLLALYKKYFQFLPNSIFSITVFEATVFSFFSTYSNFTLSHTEEIYSRWLYKHLSKILNISKSLDNYWKS